MCGPVSMAWRCLSDADRPSSLQFFSTLILSNIVFGGGGRASFSLNINSLFGYEITALSEATVI